MIREKAGQAIVEALFALGVVTVCLIGIISALATSVRNQTFARNSSIAAQLVQEGIETLRVARDRATSWPDFVADFSGDRCLGANLNWSDCNCSNSASAPMINNIFFRCARFVNSGSPVDKKIITYFVYWEDSGVRHSTETVTFLTRWSNE